MPAQGQNAWNDDQRLVLHLLYTNDPALNDTTIAALFNHIFRQQLQDRGVKKISASTLSSQYADRERRTHLWTSVWRVLQTDDEKTTRDEAHMWIRDAAEELGLDLPLPALTSTGVVEDETVTNDPEGIEESGIAEDDMDQDDIDAEDFDKDDMEEDDIEDCVDVAHGKRKATSAPGHPIIPSKRKKTGEKQPVASTSGSLINRLTCPLLQAPLTSQIPRLGMIHHKDITWKNNRAFVDSPDVAFIDHRSSTYEYGGQVHQVTVLREHEIDCMICDPFFCSECYENEGKRHGHQSLRLPFVHASDTAVKGRTPVFIPKPKAHEGIPADLHIRRMEFQVGDESVVLAVVLCNYQTCTVCSGSGNREEQALREA